MKYSKGAMEGDKVDFFPDIDFKIVSRKKWEALPPKWTEPLALPAQRIFFMFTDTERCESKKDCIKAVQTIQKHYMDLGMPDLPFSFLVGGDLRVYEGRGWGVKISRGDVPTWNDERVVIGYICPTKLADDRTNNMLRKGYQVMYHGIENKYLVDFDSYAYKMSSLKDQPEKIRRYYEEVIQKEIDKMKEAKKKKETKTKPAEDEEEDNKKDIGIEEATIDMKV